MSGGRVHDASLAFTLDGDVLVNVAHFDGLKRPNEVLRRALRERERVFIGVVLTTREVAEARHWLQNAAHEGMAYVIGRRQRRRRKRRKTP